MPKTSDPRSPLTNIYFISKHLFASSNQSRSENEFRQNTFLYFSRLWLAELKLPAGSCVSKIVNGKLVQVGDCQKNDGSEIARLIKKNLDVKKKPKNKCDVTYDLKCYRIFVTDTKNITVRDAEAICKSKNSGKPANIYDEAHFQKLHAFQRTQIIAPWKKTSVWTGMKYKNGRLQFSNGGTSSLPSSVWFPGNPSRKSSFTNVGVSVNKDPAADQGMFNNPPYYSLYGVMCEM
ncbi:uncharacterized protein LOC120332235 [Styela clava]